MKFNYCQVIASAFSSSLRGARRATKQSRKIPLFLLLLVVLTIPAKANPQKQYLEKLAPKIENKILFFKNYDLEENHEIQTWLEDLETKINPESLSQYDADLQLQFNEQGYICAIDILEDRQGDLEQFKSYMSKLIAVQAKPLPSLLSSSTVFDLNSRWNFIERKTAPSLRGAASARRHCRELLSPRHCEERQRRSNPEIPQFQTGSEIQVTLIEPNFIDHPYIGENIRVRIDAIAGEKPAAETFIKLKVYDNLKKQTILTSTSIELDGELKSFTDLVLKLARPSKDSSSSMATVVASGLGTAMTAGVGGSIATYGVLPGALALAGGGAALLKEKSQIYSFNLQRGDKFVLEIN